MKYTRTTFAFTPEFGAGLRALRRRRGLSLRGLAVLMGRDAPNAFNPLAKLERGDIKHPSLNLVLDYLRGCGVKPHEVAALFEPYLLLPPVPRTKGDTAVKKLLEVLPEKEQRLVLAWDKGIARTHEERARKMGTVPRPGRSEGLSPFPRKQPRVETERQRIFRIVWTFVHANWNEVFEQKLYETMLRLKGEVPRSERRTACEVSRRFFGVLTKYYSVAARRQNALDRIEQRAREAGFSEETIAALLDAATQSYRQLLLSGRLDWEPTQEEIIKRRGVAPKVEKAEIRLELDDVKPMSARSKAESLVRTMVFMAVDRQLNEAKLDFFLVKRHYHAWVDQLVRIALAHGTDSLEWRTEVDATAPKLHDRTFARAAAAVAAATFNIWKVKLPPRAG